MRSSVAVNDSRVTAKLFVKQHTALQQLASSMLQFVVHSRQQAVEVKNSS